MKKISNKVRRKLRNRKKLKDVNSTRLRVSVSKSLKNLSAQIIDDNLKKTIVSVTSIEKEIRSKKVKKMEKSNLSEVYFDRGEYKYHGRIKAFAETLRKNGIKF